MPGKLTTHVLDTAQGCPAVGLTIELWAIDRVGEKMLLCSSTLPLSQGFMS
jgi:5-hydroxyisourate hydrolase